MYKRILATVLLLTLKTAFTIAPFGINVGKTTKAELQKIYNIMHLGVNEFTGGTMYSINPNNVDFEDLQRLDVVMDNNDVVVGIFARFHKKKFQYLLDLLRGKYLVIAVKLPFVGNKYTKFEEDNILIELTAPHMSFETLLSYTTKSFSQLVFEKQQSRAQNTRQSNSNSL